MPLWGFKDEHVARHSAEAISTKFLNYRSESDFVGMDAARKYLQMGDTRAWRYAKHKGGKKSQPLEMEDPVKARSAEIFYEKWRIVAKDEKYLRLKDLHRNS
ncbi:hypothetical protein BH23ACT11_BH23ACT11_09900 [soil metagenome]